MLDFWHGQSTKEKQTNKQRLKLNWVGPFWDLLTSFSLFRKPYHPKMEAFITHMSKGSGAAFESPLHALPLYPNHALCEMGELTQTGGYVIPHSCPLTAPPCGYGTGDYYREFNTPTALSPYGDFSNIWFPKLRTILFSMI